MEAALRYEIERNIPELAGEIYPTNAPESASRPYLVYMRSKTNYIKALDGYTNNSVVSILFNVMAVRYEDMKRLTKKLEALLISMPRREIGQEHLFVQDIEIHNIEEAYEFELKVNRGIIDFTIYC